MCLGWESLVVHLEDEYCRKRQINSILGSLFVDIGLRVQHCARFFLVFFQWQNTISPFSFIKASHGLTNFPNSLEWITNDCPLLLPWKRLAFYAGTQVIYWELAVFRKELKLIEWQNPQNMYNVFIYLITISSHPNTSEILSTTPIRLANQGRVKIWYTYSASG